MLMTGMKEADKRGENELLVVFVVGSILWSEYCSSIALRVTAIKGLRVTDVILLEPNSLPTAETGKFARGKARTDFMSGVLPGIIYKWSIHQPSSIKAVNNFGGAPSTAGNALTDPG